MVWTYFLGTFAVCLYLLRKYLQGRQFTKNHIKIDGQVVIVTGSNTGIGKETALNLALRGGRIYMACRDSVRCEQARIEIINKTGNKNVFNRNLDLSSFHSIRNFVDQFHKEEQRLDILINNAAVMQPRALTEDGHEIQFGVNHLGHFLLTNLLLDKLIASAPSRIINVSSGAHILGEIRRDDLMGERSYTPFSAYCQSKLANVLFTKELAKRLLGTGVTANCLHPGVVKTEIFRNAPRIWQYFYPLLYFFKTAKSGAQTTLTVALDPDLDKITGKYFDDCKMKEVSKAAQDDETATWLWLTSEKLCGLIK